MAKDKYLPVSADHPTVFITTQGAEGKFDVTPFLQTLEMYGSDGMAKNLDDMMLDLTTYYMDTDPGYTRASEMLYTLRILRNALLTGGDWFQISQ